MKPLLEQDHYEVLEVPRDTDIQEIERAYEVARTTWSQGSLAGYSLFDDSDTEVIRERVETAYRVLVDADSRRAYDASLAAVRRDEPAPLPAPARVPEPLGFDAMEEMEEDGDEFDGLRLRRARLRRGFDVDDVVRVTKLNPTYVRFLEEERFLELPARVYVRGFVMAYARCVGLEAEPVARSYMERFDGARASAGRRARR